MANLHAMLDNREPIRERQDRILENPEYTALFKDLQSNILTPHGYERAHYFFVKFKDDELVITRYLLGMLPRTGFERANIRNAIMNPSIREHLSPDLATLATKWTAEEAPAGIDEATHRKLKDVRVVSEYDVYWRRCNEPKRLASRQKAREFVQRRAEGDGLSPADALQEAKETHPTENETPRVAPSYLFSVNVMLTPSGYSKLGRGIACPADEAFNEGMPARGSKLNDPPRSTWCNEEQPWDQVDALIVLAYTPDANSEAARSDQAKKVAALELLIRAHAHLLFQERGDVLWAGEGENRYQIEPFGFRDGISQPVFYMSHRDAIGVPVPAVAPIGAPAWDPTAPLRLVLSPDPNGRTAYSCGSYLVFRKLQQDIQRFYSQSASIAALKQWDPEDLRPLFIGRKRDGTPLVEHAGQNTFHFMKDPQGEQCPFHAHIRKNNPRSDLPAAYGVREHRIVRRGMPYGTQIKRNAYGIPEGGPELQAAEVGMLFMCAQTDIANQFEHLQARWANKPDVVRGKTPGVDTLSGQLRAGEKNLIAVEDKTKDRTIAKSTGNTEMYEQVVTLKGGGYFFAPSISFLRGLLGDLLDGAV